MLLNIFAAIILMGEPDRWEMHLQLLVDLLITDGKPDHKPDGFPETHPPILACNMTFNLWPKPACQGKRRGSRDLKKNVLLKAF